MPSGGSGPVRSQWTQVTHRLRSRAALRAWSSRAASTVDARSPRRPSAAAARLCRPAPQPRSSTRAPAGDHGAVPLEPGARPGGGSRRFRGAGHVGQGALTSVRAALAELAARELDLLVIGGGITGAGILRDAAMRGLQAALVDAADFGAGTSSRSSRLIHGGLRYLEHGHWAWCSRPSASAPSCSASPRTSSVRSPSSCPPTRATGCPRGNWPRGSGCTDCSRWAGMWPGPGCSARRPCSPASRISGSGD